MATKIQWTEETWNPIQGCFKVSPGCKNCYAIRQVLRLKDNPNQKIKNRYFNIVNDSPNWTGEVGFDEEVLLQPLKRRKPTTYFISLSDLFYDKRPYEHIDLVFSVMAATPQHTYQILTKYPERMLAWFSRLKKAAEGYRPTTVCQTFSESDFLNLRWMIWRYGMGPAFPHGAWPLPNVQLGVSVEDQQYADERIPMLLRTPAALRFVSYEPALAEVNFTKFLTPRDSDNPNSGSEHSRIDGEDTPESLIPTGPANAEAVAKKVAAIQQGAERRGVGIDWVIVGGESGPGARPLDIAWARSAVKQCKAADVPCFVKQLGANPVVDAGRQHHYDFGEFIGRKARFSPVDPLHPSTGQWRVHFDDKKGGDMSEWSKDLRVREMPRGME